MPVPAQVRRRCQELLEPGERISYLIPIAAVGIGAVTSGIDCYIAVTDRRIAVILGDLLRRGRRAEINVQYRRSTRLGPVEFVPVPTFQLGNRFYEIEDEYVAEVNAADAEIDGDDALPRDPYPDLPADH